MASTIEELRKLSEEGKLIVRTHGSWEEEVVKIWDKFYNKKSPKEFYNSISKNLGDAAVVLDIDFEGYTTLNIYLYKDDVIKRDELNGHTSAAFSIIHSDNKASLDDIIVNDQDDRAAGIGRNILANTFGIFEEIGIEKIKITATNIGGYAWSKFGFVPSSEAWENIKIFIEGTYNKMLTDLLLHHPNFCDVIEKCLQSDDPKSMWLISDLAGKASYYDVDEIREKEVSVGAAFLLHSAWNGEFDFNDKDCVERFNSYVGKDRKISEEKIAGRQI